MPRQDRLHSLVKSCGVSFGRRHARPLVLLALAVAAPAARAADDVDPFALSPEQLFEATVVSASKTPERLGDAPAAIYVLTNEDILRSGATSIPEALRLVPGVQVARINTAGWAVSVRGFNNPLANKLLVLIDGRQVYDPLFSGVYWDVQDVPLEDIDRIEVIRGPGASLWGANAVNGVINIITKKSSETQGLLVSATAGNDERALITAQYGGADGDNLHWRIYGRYLDRASGETLSGADAEDGWIAWRGGFRLDWDRPDQNDMLTLQGDLYQSDTGQFRSVPELISPYAAIVHEDISASGGNLVGRWSRELGDDSRFTVQAYADVTKRGQYTLDDSRSTFNLDTQFEFPAWGAHKVVAGARYDYSVDALEASPIISFTKATRGDQLFSVFGQDRIGLGDAWALTLGSKLEHNDYSGFEVQPTARLQWNGDEQMAWASISRAVRTPSRLESDLDIVAGVIAPSAALPFPVQVELKPSPDFDSEELVAYEFGYRRQWTPSLLMDVSTFYNDYQKLATLTLLAPQVLSPPLHVVLPVATTNMTSGETYGGEAVLDWRVAENFKLSAAYSLLEMSLTGPPANLAIASEAAEDQSPRQQFNIRSQWDVGDAVALDGTVYYVDPLPGYRVPAYWRVDARIGWHPTDRLSFDLVGQNLLDDSHREFSAPSDVNASPVGRSVFGRVLWRP